MDRNISLALYHRDHLSVGNSRKTFKYEAFHWTIMIVPDGQSGGICDEYDATDSSEIDRVTWRVNNPTMDWWFRARTGVDPSLNPKLIGRVIVGHSTEKDAANLKELFEKIPLPLKHSHPQQSCVTWALDAIRTLQDQGFVGEFDVDMFKDWALNYADERMAKKDTRIVVDYTKEQK